MDIFLQLTLSGLSQGAIFALIALSLTVVYRATTIYPLSRSMRELRIYMEGIADLHGGNCGS
ncbi:MAG: hypothetical protein CFH06_01325, partial [Alphaproteobacteria bacterium MarineAlpha3_Bin5]